MRKYYLTFGGYQGLALKGKCVIIQAISEQAARRLAMSIFDKHWCVIRDDKPSEDVVEMKTAIRLARIVNAIY